MSLDAPYQRSEENTQQSSQQTTVATVPGSLTQRLDRLTAAEPAGRRRSSHYAELAGATRDTFHDLNQKLKCLNSEMLLMSNTVKALEEKGNLDEDQLFFQSLLQSVR